MLANILVFSTKDWQKFWILSVLLMVVLFVCLEWFSWLALFCCWRRYSIAQSTLLCICNFKLMFLCEIVVFFNFYIFSWFSVLVPTMYVSSLLEWIDSVIFVFLSMLSDSPRWLAGFPIDAVPGLCNYFCLVIHLVLVWTVMVG